MSTRPSPLARNASRVPRTFRAVLLTAWLSAVVVLVSCARDPSPDGPGAVLLVTIDTVPADRLGCYGCPSVRTPHLDRLARSGLQVIDAIAPAPITLPSHTTMLTGAAPPQHGVRDNGLFRLPDEAVTLAERLPADVRKAAFVGSFPLASRFGLAQGFDLYDDDFGPSRDGQHAPERRADEVFRRAAEWLAGSGAGRRPFVWTHVFDAHSPYASPPPWGRVAATLRGGGDYEGEIAFLDSELGRYLARVGAERADRRATVLVAADHGESLGAHGELTHSIFVYDATQRVPLLLAGPGIAPRLDREQRQLMDVTPTILFAYGIDAPEGGGDPLQDNAPAGDAYVETKYTELMRGWSPLHGIRTREWKYIRAPRPELYDLRVDPGELNNVHDAHPAVVAELSAEVDLVLAAGVESGAGSMDPDTAERLRSLGYVATIAPGAVADTRKDPKDGIAAVVEVARGQTAYLARDLRTAESHFLRALELDPDAKEAHAFLSGTYHGLGRYDLAVEHARRALEMEPHVNEGPIRSTLGEALLALDRPREALPHLTAALAERPVDPKLVRLVEEARRRAR